MSDKPIPEIVWVDLEATGLSLESDVMLELGMRITDWSGHVEFARFTSLVWDWDWRNRLNLAPDLVVTMHRESGLIAEVGEIERLPPRDRNQFSPERVAKKAELWLEEHAGGAGPHGGQYPISGNSIHYDRAMLRSHMRVVHDWFHYRNHDVSALRESCRLANPTLHSREPEVPKVHRPQQDIDNSITLWQHYIDNFLWVGHEV